MKKNRAKVITKIDIVKKTESGEFDDISLDEHDPMPSLQKSKSRKADIDPFFDNVPQALQRTQTITDLSIFKRPLPFDAEEKTGCGCFSFRSKK